MLGKDDKCENCMFWAPYPHMTEIAKMPGECRHELPKIRGTREQAAWANTAPSDWCRMHKPRDQKE
jgi:hypothetical protein